MSGYKDTEKRLTPAEFYHAFVAQMLQPRVNCELDRLPLDKSHSVIRAEIIHGRSDKTHGRVILYWIECELTTGNVTIYGIDIDAVSCVVERKFPLDLVKFDPGHREIIIHPGFDHKIGFDEVLSSVGDSFVPSPDQLRGNVVDVILQLCVKIGICELNTD